MLFVKVLFILCFWFSSPKYFVSSFSQPIRNIQYSFFKKAYLAAVSDDGSLYLWDTNTNKLLTTFDDAHKAPATALAFSPLNNLLLASCGLDKRILCYDIMSKK